MRKRLLWWVIGPLAVLLALAGALLFVPDGKPYGFLASFEEVELTVTNEERRQMEKEGFRAGVYHAKASYDDVLKKAQAELTPMGYRLERDLGIEGLSAFVRGSYLVPSAGSATPASVPEFIFVLKDTRVQPKVAAKTFFETAIYPDHKGKDPGWVTVAAMTRFNPTYWGRIKQWIGL